MVMGVPRHNRENAQNAQVFNLYFDPKGSQGTKEQLT